jgi:formamidopyrimidine-DNA glycosylase
MPELPEAENICRALDRALRGRTITRVEVFTPAMRTSLLPLKSAALEGVKIEGTRRRGRYVVADLADGRGLLMHFGMSGVVRVEGAEIPRRKHEHVFLHLDDGRIFRFECTRRFSLLEVVSKYAPDGWPEALSGLGVEPLSEAFSGEYLYASSRRRKVAVKLLLMDNAVVTGIGNIYANEALFAARVSPERPSPELTKGECRRLVSAAKAILARAIEAGGTTISDFLNVDGSEGKFVRELKIYGRAGQPCPACGCEVRSVRQGGRSSFYCPKCQK